MKKIFAALTLTSSLFASDALFDRMKNNADQDLITHLARTGQPYDFDRIEKNADQDLINQLIKNPKSEEMWTAIGHYLSYVLSK